jgi:hypothetical protein
VVSRAALPQPVQLGGFRAIRPMAGTWVSRGYDEQHAKHGEYLL